MSACVTSRNNHSPTGVGDQRDGLKDDYATSPECAGDPPTCDVIHYDRGGRVSDVAWDEATKPLLPRRVPQLQPDLWGRKGVGNKRREKTKTKKKDENKTRRKKKSYVDKNKKLKNK